MNIRNLEHYKDPTAGVACQHMEGKKKVVIGGVYLYYKKNRVDASRCLVVAKSKNVVTMLRVTGNQHEHTIEVAPGDYICVDMLQYCYISELGELSYTCDAEKMTAIRKELAKYLGFVKKKPVLTTNAEYFRNITKQMADVYTAKNHDYGNSYSSLRKEFPSSVLIRLSDKLNRLKTLMVGNNAQVNDESIDDTLLDLANYAIMELVERRMEKEHETVSK